MAATFPECFRSGKVNHSSDTYFFRNSKCHGYRKAGHIVRKCPEKEQKPESEKKKWKSKFGKKKKKQQKIRFLKEDPAVRQSERVEVIGPCLPFRIPVENVKNLSYQ